MIQNAEQLIKNGVTPGEKILRRLVLQAYSAALVATSPQRILAEQVKLLGSTLSVKGHKFDLNKFRNIYVVGGGKAAGAMANALENILGKYISCGCVNVPHGSAGGGRIKLNFAGHPMPDASGVKGVCEMLSIAEHAQADDLIICLVSGGGSSLMPLPRGGISLDDKREITSALLRSGAKIGEINTVRKHISAFKGGWLAKKAFPATVINLILSDVIGDSLEFIASGPAVPDSTTFADAVAVLKKHSLFDNAPASMQKLLLDGLDGIVAETPKADDPAFSEVFNFVIGNNTTAINAVIECLQAAGVETMTMGVQLECDVETAVVQIIEKIGEKLAHRHCSVPLALIAGGELTVKVKGDGIGGRNQEMALAAAIKCENAREYVFAALSTDGIDGPTDASGAIVDSHTLSRALEKAISPQAFLQRNDSYNFFRSLGDIVHTGYTGTNVNDLYLAIFSMHES